METKVLNSTHDKKIKYSTQLIVFTCGPGDDVEIKDYVVFPPGQDNLLSSDYTVDFGRYDDA